MTQSCASYSVDINSTATTTTDPTTTTPTPKPEQQQQQQQQQQQTGGVNNKKKKNYQNHNQNHSHNNNSAAHNQYKQQRRDTAFVNKHLSTLLARVNGQSSLNQNQNHKKTQYNNNNSDPFQSAIHYATQHIHQLNNQSFTMLYDMASKIHHHQQHHHQRQQHQQQQQQQSVSTATDSKYLHRVKQVDQLLRQVVPQQQQQQQSPTSQQSQQSQSLHASPIVFSSRMNAYIKIGHIPMALDLFHQHCGHALPPQSQQSSPQSPQSSSTTSTTNNNNSQVVVPIVPDTLIYNLYLMCHILMNQLDKVFSTLEWMRRSGVRPNVRTLTLMMEYLVRSGRVERALVMFQEYATSQMNMMMNTMMNSDGGQHGGGDVNSDNHSTYSVHYGGSGSNSSNSSNNDGGGGVRESNDTRSMVFNVLLKSLIQLVPTSSSSSSQNNSNNNYAQRRSHHNRAPNSNGGSDMSSSSGVGQINMKFISNIFYKIRDLHLQNVMQQQQKQQQQQQNNNNNGANSEQSQSQSQHAQHFSIMDTVSYNTMLKAFYDHGQFYDAKRLIACLAEDAQIDAQLTLTLHTYNTILDSLAQTGRLDEALDIMDHIMMHSSSSTTNSGVRPNAYTFAILLNACAKLHDLQRAHLIFARAIQSGIAPDHNLCTSMMKVFGVCGESTEAMQFIETMRHMGIEPSAWVYVGLFKAFRREMKFEEAWNYLDQRIMGGTTNHNHNGSSPSSSFDDLNIHFISGLSHLVRNRDHMNILMPMYRSVRDKCLKPWNSNNNNNNSGSGSGSGAGSSSQMSPSFMMIDFAVEDSTGLKVETFYKRVLREALFLNMQDVSLELLCDMSRSIGMSQSDIVSLFNYFLELQILNQNDRELAATVRPHKVAVMNKIVEMSRRGEAKLPRHSTLLTHVRNFVAQTPADAKELIDLAAFESWVKQGRFSSWINHWNLIQWSNLTKIVETIINIYFTRRLIPWLNPGWVWRFVSALCPISPLVQSFGLSLDWELMNSCGEA